MKLLFDQNVPPRLVRALEDLYPGSTHVALVELDRATDRAVSTYARERGYVVVTKDADFAELALHGHPVLKVVWLRLGNCTTNELERILRDSAAVLAQLADDPDARVLSLE